MKKAWEYRKHAEECRQMIAAANDDQQRAMLEHMAQTWDALANDRERWARQKRRIADLETSEKPA